MQNIKYIGVDEAGRGPWAGPIVAAAVILLRPIPGLNDSKQLSRKKRALLRMQICQSAHVGIGWVQPAYIDRNGLTAATSTAMSCAVDQLGDVAGVKIIVDGSYDYLNRYSNVETVIKADALYAGVSAASIIAKELRDDFMRNMAVLFPEYGFESHKGYGTKNHAAALSRYGVTDLHRKSYAPVKKFM